ncbi:hypothetical protein A3C17_03835 [Candidatus Uhrbacteria bacterium RIFCSPHIGHO2_02_FULL_53_13]|uniref:Nudix hydrolase domain-containing protein n=2 Tax=Candidatus Uhriibacteriota TaxID=1752732 RepID=A0A1F7TZ00_9BACT|nr:MAG: hypothetical protein A3C17_03835 [Candidatus Uhrbacteria bacterium RIFCSPHIGHO2_02_FULL_53_13]OGL89976.1 MAG: hypothetical protein A3I45_02495 [Candidatus Uhrbacteria bacterium RIFCSPLOWO2_02_FULL_53_10]
MSQQRHFAVPAVYLILKKGNEVLLQMRQGSEYFDDWWAIPAGHVEPGELPIAALVREVKEEIGIDLDMGRTHFVHTMYRTAHDETGDRADYFWMTEAWGGEPSICEPHKCKEIKWMPIDALPQNTIPHVRQAIEFVRDGVSYSEFGTEDSVPSPS